MKETLIWLGVRESDIAVTGNMFQRSITIFGTGKNGNISMERELGKRYNHNGEMLEFESFFTEAMEQMLEEDPNIKFLQYDSLDSEVFPEHLRNKIYYKNSYNLLHLINDKKALKIWASKYVNILPYQLLKGSQIGNDGFNCYFPNSELLVVQRSFSCGGEGTFLVHKGQFRNNNFQLDSSEQCIVTEYKKNNISVNIHAVVYEKQVILFPPSVQLISLENNRLEYIGSDYSAFNTLSQHEKKLVLSEAMKIGKALQAERYLGVCGIDFILVDGCCFFMEVNGRFQASSALLNNDLVNNGFPTLQEYHIDAFHNRYASLPMPPVNAVGSMINFYIDDENHERINWLRARISQSVDFTMCDDGFSWSRDYELGCYVFQLRSSRSISSITYQKTVRIHPNARISTFSLDCSETYDNLLKLKILLLSRGLSIAPTVWKAIQETGGADWEEFGAVTLKIFDKIWITAPCLERWYSISPLEIDYDRDSGDTILYYYGKKLFPIEVMKADPYGEKLTKNGHHIKDIVYMNPDRLRVYHRNGCALQNRGLGCKFCDLYGVDKPFTFEEICEAVSYYLDDERVNHFLIGGGSELLNNQCETIINLARFLHERSGKNIYLMSQPINDPNLLHDLKNLGVTEVAFNIEMFNRDLAKLVMPGKSKNSLKDYYDSLTMAVNLWGRSGNVRSMILLGFDDITEFEKGIYELCKLGVAPILSLFRPCPNTPLEEYMPLNEKETLCYFETAKSICDKFGIKLGPSCKACQNNTVVLDM